MKWKNQRWLLMVAVLARLCVAHAAPTTTLPEDRFLDFNDYMKTNVSDQVWRHEGGSPPLDTRYAPLLFGTNHYHRSGWILKSCRTGSSWYLDNARSIPPRDPATVPLVKPYLATNLAANLQNAAGAYIESPIFTNGVGVVYFEAINNDPGYTNRLSIEIATNMWWTDQGVVTNTLMAATNATLSYHWEKMDDLTLFAATSNDFVRYSRKLNWRSPAKIRIVRAGEVYYFASGPNDKAFTVVDNIRISYPPADVTIDKTEVPFEPGYPSVGTNVAIRCYVSNAEPNAESFLCTTSRTVKVVYRWRYLSQVIGPWRTNVLNYVAGTGTGVNGNGSRYKGDIDTFSEMGDLEYFFVCDFGGYEYQSPDVTKTGVAGDLSFSDTGFPYPTEGIGRRTLGSASSCFTVRIRPYKSRFGTLYAKTDQLADPIAMELTGDNEWRAMVPVARTGITNLTWQFQGSGEYVANAEVTLSATNRWAGLSAVTGGNVPYGGVCVPTNETGRLRVGIPSGGSYAMLTFNTDSLQYLANRSEYQDFNYWPSAPLNVFSDSSLEVQKQYFFESFNTWPTNTDQTYQESFVGQRDYPSTTNVYYRGPFDTIGFWIAGSAALVQERTFDASPDAAFGARNYALRLQGGSGSLGLGYIQSNPTHLPDGLRQVAFSARLGQACDNNNVVYRRTNFTSANYLVRATARAVSTMTISPEMPSISLVGYFQDPENFYEFRVTQVTNATDTAANFQDLRARFEILKWMNGSVSVLASTIQTLGSSPLTSINDSAQMEMRLYNNTASSTRIRCKYGTTDNIVIALDSTSPLQYGTFGFMSGECKSYLSNVIVYDTGADAAATAIGLGTVLGTGTSFSTDVASWRIPSTRYEAKVLGPGVATSAIYSKTPSQSLGVYLQSTTFGSTTGPDGASWTLVGTVPITNFAYATTVIPFSTCDSKYVKLQVVGGDADVVVDAFYLHSWHGQTSTSANGWRVTEAWIATNTASVSTLIELDQTRAAAEDQSIRSLLLTNGLGVIEFDYRVNRAPALLKIQYSEKNSPDTWNDIDSITVSNIVGWTHAASYLGLSKAGYFRVLNARGSYTNGWADINDVTVWDEPSVTNTAWKVYNAKITNTETNRIYIDQTKACFLNNNTTNETLPTQSFFLPSLTSPLLPKGLGSISFLGRAYSSNQAATVYVYASTNGWNAPTNKWFVLATFSNITNMYYKPFTFTPEGGRKDVSAIKLTSQNAFTDSKGRVCLENVVVSEPVLPGFEIANVKLLDFLSTDSYVDYPQPLAGEVVHIQAEVVNQQMTPSNIAMYVDYYVGTNVWGADNWWASAQKITRRMHPVTNALGQTVCYRTRMDYGALVGLESSLIGGIAGQDSGVVVQYRVWADYMGGVPLKAYQSTFENPSWYYPVDLNATYTSLGWSPYYIVYDVPRNAVWINEINAYDSQVDSSLTKYNNRYIEIAKPAWLDLAGWGIEVVYGSAYNTYTITIPKGLPEKVADTNGYYFFVIGNAGSPSLPREDLGFTSLNTYMSQTRPTGFRLKRPMGMFEQTIVYDRYAYNDSSLYSGTFWASNDPLGKFAYVGKEAEGGSLARVGTTDTTNSWVFPQTWSPGAPNVGQQYPAGNGNSLMQGTSNVWITSIMNLFHGTQNDSRLSSYSVKIKKGAGTNITYRIDDWYRLYSVTVSGSEQLSPAEASAGQRAYTLALSNVQTSLTVMASVQLRKDLSTFTGTSGLLSWLMGFPDGALVPSYYLKSTKGGAIDWSGSRELSMLELYWLNADPTKTNRFEFATTGFWVDPPTSNLLVQIKMSLNETNSITSLQGGAVLKLRVKGSLFDPDWSLVRQFSVGDASFGTNHTSTVFVANPFKILLPDITNPVGLNFYIRWKMEVSDPRVGIVPLIDLGP